ncbi:zinc finger protein-like [Tropilaelaps mercedesae]|uniref:Zinc finger protein-like n=1 Tax=Tropilaelaps mercedesae TaxID=418985 RepID=A0A1V9XG45_9ACAR|nr:zinc finger protein-like [Tropilaelaps mercedesae]
MEEPRRVMICRKVIGADGVARVVLEPAENAPAIAQTQPAITDDNDNPAEDDSMPSIECGGKSAKPSIQCEICGKKFYVTDTTYRRTPKERLTLHIVTEHDKERLYQCNYEGCFKAYNNVKQLNQHKLVHSNRKNHKCPQCPKRFHRKTHLLAHMRRHNANPNFKPRASRRQCNPYIQVQRKKNAMSTDEAEATPTSATEEATTTYEVIESTNCKHFVASKWMIRTLLLSADSVDAAGAGTTVVVVTQEELDQMRRMNPDVVEREAVMAYDVIEGCADNATEREHAQKVLPLVAGHQSDLEDMPE